MGCGARARHSGARHRTRVYPSSAISLSKSATADLDARTRNPDTAMALDSGFAREARGRPGMTTAESGGAWAGSRRGCFKCKAAGRVPARRISHAPEDSDALV